MIHVQSNILIVDSVPSSRKFSRDLLLGEGYRVDVCDNGDDAISLLTQRSIDLVLTDLVLPGKSGLEVFQAARALKNPPEVVLLTDRDGLESAVEALKNGVSNYLVKPFGSGELQHLVRNSLSQRNLLLENHHLQRQIHLFQAGQPLSSLMDLDQLLPRSLDALLAEMGATAGCSFTLKDSSVPTLFRTKKVSADLAEYLIELLLPQFDAEACLCRANEDIAPQLVKLQQQPQCVWILPLRDGAVVKGGLIVCDAADDLSDLAGLDYLCEQVKLGFANTCRYQAAQELMYTDDLTGLHNHRYMQISLSREIRRAKRYGLKFSLLFLDLDRFKEINDQYGHLAGSSALQEVGELLANCIRDVDTLFRFGGDEFAAILVETDDRTARIVAERIRHIIESHTFLAKQGTPSYVTVTSGFATFPTDATEKKDLLDLADRAMYTGKVTRNVICGVVDIPKDDG